MDDIEMNFRYEIEGFIGCKFYNNILSFSAKNIEVNEPEIL